MSSAEYAAKSAGSTVRPALSRALAYTVALIGAAVVLVPLIYVVIGGFRTTGQIAASPVALPHPWIWSNYTDILTSATFWDLISNSLIIAVVATGLVVALGALAAYPLARYEF